MASNKRVQKENADEKVEDEVVETLYDVTIKRSVAPKRLADIERETLKHRQKQAENVTVLPSLDSKRVVTKHTLTKSLPEQKEFSQSPGTETMLTRVNNLCEMLPGIKTALEGVQSEQIKKKTN